VHASLANNASQRSGIMNNPGSVCHIHNNWIVDSMSRGIYIQGNGGNHVYQNVVVRPGQLANSKGDGIVISTGSNTGRGILAWGNMIVHPGRYGVLFRNDQGDNNLIKNNIVVGRSDQAADDAAAFIESNGLSNVAIVDNLFVRNGHMQQCMDAHYVDNFLSGVRNVLWCYVARDVPVVDWLAR